LLSGLEVALGVAALVVGATGTWSPCGFSMVETIGPRGHTGGRRTTLAACASFLPGAVIGGVATFAALALFGGLLHGTGGRAAYVAAAAIAVLAALAEARGARIMPQVRRQLPEHWRRLMPMPLAAFLYGILLGLGFTTFVLTFGVWALAGISLALGQPETGLLIGAAFGVGRALPVVALAPSADGRFGVRALDTMAQRPGIYRGFRLGDAVALLVAAAALVAGQPDPAGATRAASGGGDPAAFGDDLVFERPNGDAVLQHDGTRIDLPGSDPAVGGPYVAVRVGQEIRLLDREGLEPVAEIEAEHVDALAVSSAWLTYRAHRPSGTDFIKVRNISDLDQIGSARTVARAKGAAQLSRPSVDRSILVYGIAGRARSRIVQRRLGDRIGRRRTLVASRRWLLFNPAINGRKIAYARTIGGGTQVLIKRRGRRGRGRRVFSRGRRKGTLWTLALTDERVYATVLEFGKRGHGYPNLLVKRR
jgi:hypothetical protein